MPPDDLIGTAEAAAIINRSRRTVQRLVQAGELIPVYIAPGGYAGSFLFSRKDVEKIAARFVGGSAA